MIEEFNKIAELKTVRDEKKKLAEKENELSTPLLTDLSHIPKIFAWFCEESGCDSQAKLTTDEKYQFLFIILCLYSPAALTGGQLQKGVRGAIARVFDYRSESGVSNHLKNVAASYDNYKSFRAKVDTLYLEITDRLKKEGLLPESNLRKY